MPPGPIRLLDDMPPVVTVPAGRRGQCDRHPDPGRDLGAATATDFKDGGVRAAPTDRGPVPAGSQRRHLERAPMPPATGARRLPVRRRRADGQLPGRQACAEGVTARVACGAERPGRGLPGHGALSQSAARPRTRTTTTARPARPSSPSGLGRRTIDIDIVKDANAEPDETIVLTMGTPANAIAGELSAPTRSR